jgi:hypothetical protein
LSGLHVHLAAHAPTTDIPPRVPEHGVEEILEALGTPRAAGVPLDEALRAAFGALGDQQLGERLLDMVLMKPPIPAGCEALMHAMATREVPPWRTHEVPSDRVWLWYAHHLLHRAYPERFPPPTIHRLTLRLWADPADDAAPRLPSATARRVSVHARGALAALALRGAPGVDAPGVSHADVLAALADAEAAYDVVWAAEIAGHEPLSDADRDAGWHGEVPAVVLTVWLDAPWLAARAGDRWQVTETP